MPSDLDTVVIGGGFFGCTLACHLARRGRVLLLEQGAELLGRASFANQARVHHGYHYPRSLRTALSCSVNYARFLRDYADCAAGGFRHLYAIARRFSKVSAGYFELFCKRVGIPLRRVRDPAPFDPDMVEAVFEVEEVVFDASRLRRRLGAALARAGVELRLGVTAERVEPVGNGALAVHCAGPGAEAIRAGQVFNCTYSGINCLLLRSGLAPLPLKHELAELALVAVPASLARAGVTVMCGPFFSLLPFPALGLHSLSHVRYTPHASWRDPADPPARPASNFPGMVRDASRFLPALAQCRQHGSLWEVKTVLLASETNDSRPILFQRHAGLPNLHCVLGAKLDNVFDVLDELDGPTAPGVHADERGAA
jgi:glycine/D-amino acid oxidase-like deaminating enzyme